MNVAADAMTGAGGAGGRAVRRLTTVREVFALFPGDVLVRHESGGGPRIAAWAVGEADGPKALAFVAPAYDGDGLWLTALGAGALVPELVDAVLADLAGPGAVDGKVCGLTVPRAVGLAPWGAAQSDDSGWDMMVAEAPPAAQPAEDAVDILTDLDEVQAFLDAVNPHHSVRSDDPTVSVWAGMRDAPSGALLGVGALTYRPSGLPYLASIATTAAARGRGVGGAVTALLTRRAFEDGAGLCSLAHYHPNDPARRLYLRLGYRTTHQNSSGRFPVAY